MEDEKVYIWGTGKYGRKVLPAVRTEYCSIEGFIDNDPLNTERCIRVLRLYLLER